MLSYVFLGEYPVPLSRSTEERGSVTLKNHCINIFLFYNCIVFVTRRNSILKGIIRDYYKGLKGITVKPLITNTSKEFIKCRLDNFSMNLILYYVNFSICENK